MNECKSCNSNEKTFFMCCICKNRYCFDCKTSKLVNNQMNCLDCYSHLEYTLYMSITNQNICKIKRLISNINFSGDCLNTSFINSILTFNIEIIDFLINFTSDPEIYTKMALTTFLFHNTNGLYKENQIAKYLIDKIYNKFDLLHILEQMNQKNINLDIIEYLELKINN